MFKPSWKRKLRFPTNDILSTLSHTTFWVYPTVNKYPKRIFLTTNVSNKYTLVNMDRQTNEQTKGDQKSSVELKTVKFDQKTYLTKIIFFPRLVVYDVLFLIGTYVFFYCDIVYSLWFFKRKLHTVYCFAAIMWSLSRKSYCGPMRLPWEMILTNLILYYVRKFTCVKISFWLSGS
jgi:hypothetical protein